MALLLTSFVGARAAAEVDSGLHAGLSDAVQTDGSGIPDGGAYTVVPEGGIGDTGAGCSLLPSGGERAIMVLAVAAALAFVRRFRGSLP